MVRKISKSNFCLGIQCKKALYLKIHKPELADPITADDQLKFDQGHQVGALAQTYFPGGALIAEDHSQHDLALEKTKALMNEAKVPAIFEAAITFQNIFVRTDILQNNFDGTWTLFEVKSSTEFKDQYLNDVGIQLWALLKSGIKIKKAYLRHVNNESTSPELKNFFMDVDLTEKALDLFPEIEKTIAEETRLIADNKMPNVFIGGHCNKPEACSFKSHCWKDVPKGSVLELYRAHAKTKFPLYHQKTNLIKDLEIGTKLTDFQKRQFKASQQDGAVIDYKGLHSFLNELEYPLFYFDFETIAPAIPIFEGAKPYQKIPMQYSCHIVKAPGAAIEHNYYLATTKGDPREECKDAMIKLFNNTTGSIIAYHASFEKEVIAGLGEHFPTHKDFFLSLTSRFWDLEDAFQKYFYHRDFQGSASIKKTLPYFSPEMDYSKLAIKNGGEAQAALMKLFEDTLSKEEKESIRNNLLVYCEQDSMAMLVIHRALEKYLRK